MSIQRLLLANFFSGMLGRVISSIGTLLVVPLMLKAWGVAMYGEWLILIAIPSYLMLAPDCGLSGAIINRMAHLSSAGKRGEAIVIYGSAWCIQIMLSVVVVLICSVAGIFVKWQTVGVVQLCESARLIVSFNCIYLMVAQQTQLLSGIYRCAEANARYQIIVGCVDAITLSFGCAALVLKCDPTVYSLAIMIARIVGYILVHCDVRRAMPDFVIDVTKFSFRDVKPYIVPGAGHAGMPLVHALQSHGVLLVIGKCLGAESVGQFQTIRTVANGVKAIMSIPGTAIAVELPNIIGSQRWEVCKKLLTRNSQILLMIAAISILIVTPNGKVLLEAWTGGKVGYNAILAVMLLGSLLPYAIFSSFGMYLLTTNNMHKVIVPLLIAAAASLGALLLGVERMGVNWAGVIIAAWETIAGCCYYYGVKRFTPLKAKEQLHSIPNLNGIKNDIRSYLQKESFAIFWRSQ